MGKSKHDVASGNQRRSQRILVSVSVCVTGKRPVNAHGALILLKEEVAVGQTITVEHIASKQTIEGQTLHQIFFSLSANNQ